MTVDSNTLAAVRRAMESAYGLAMDGLQEEQIALAISTAVQTGETAHPLDRRFLARVLDRLPIDESWLFRDDDLWTWLSSQAGPELLERVMSRARPLRVLSIGCSTGQEVFSLGILFQGLLQSSGIPGSAASSFVEIHGLDSSPERIETARSGTVNNWSVQRCRAEWLRGRVGPGDPVTGRHLVDGSVRAMCHFDVGNLMDLAERGNAVLGGYDLVLCRHVLIYFNPIEAERLAGQIARGLDPGAYLVLAAAEAHLISVSGALEPQAQLGAGRSRTAEELRVVGAAVQARKQRRSALRRDPVEHRSPSPAASGAELAAAHVRSAIEHSAAGRDLEAEREARAACFIDPRHLLSRMVLGKALIATDRDRGREVLRELLHHVSRMPQEDEVPSAPGLSVGQLTAAVRLLLGESEGI